MEEKVEDKGTGSSEVISSPSAAGDAGQAFRSNFVELAVKFLNNSRVSEQPMDDKKAFLRKKGLTEGEIDTAVSRASQSPPTIATGVPAVSGNAPPLPPRPLTPALQPSWSRTWSEYAFMAAVAGGVAYALSHFFKNYVIPWFNAPRVHEQKLDDVHASVSQLQTTVSETVSSLAESTRSIQLLLSEQQQHIQLLTTQVTGLQTSLAHQTSDQSLKQLKEEMSSLKGIMLSRHQFPPTPTRGGVANGGGIPVWQRALVSSDSGTPTKQQQLNTNGDVTKTDGENGNETVLQNGNETVLQNGNETVLQNGNETVLQNGNETDENGALHKAEGLLDETSAS